MHTIKWLTNTDDITDALKIRKEVFIKEQNVPHEIEFDGSDSYALSVVVYDEEKPVATGRIILRDENYTLGRICVLSEYRNKKYGSVVVNELIKKCKDIGASSIHIHAQTQVIPFYEKLGFTCYGDEYKEAGIKHISMVLEI